MDHQAFAQMLGSYGEFVGAIAVVVTLVYLSIQIRIGNKQREIESLRHNWDGLNRVCELLGESTEKASIVLRGRNSLDDLSDEERLVFKFIHIRILNTIEAWYLQLMDTSPAGEYRDQQLQNIADVIAFTFNFSGALEIWREVRHTFVPIESLFDDAISGVNVGSDAHP